jgi:hypothetical protein
MLSGHGATCAIASRDVRVGTTLSLSFAHGRALGELFALILVFSRRSGTIKSVCLLFPAFSRTKTCKTERGSEAVNELIESRFIRIVK